MQTADTVPKTRTIIWPALNSGCPLVAGGIVIDEADAEYVNVADGKIEGEAAGWEVEVVATGTLDESGRSIGPQNYH